MFKIGDRIRVNKECRIGENVVIPEGYITTIEAIHESICKLQHYFWVPNSALDLYNPPPKVGGEFI